MRLAAALLAFCFPAIAQSLLIRDVTVIDATGSPPRIANVFINAGKIVSVGSRTQKAARIVNGKGRFLIPALWDMHVHLWESEPFFPLYIANGVLGVRDMGSDLGRTRAWARQQPSGPKVYTSGPPVDAGPSSAGFKVKPFQAAGTADTMRAIDQIDDSGADFVKILSGLSRDQYIAVAQRARALRIPFSGHLPPSVSLDQAINSRQRSIEHLFGVLLSCSSEEGELRAARAEAQARNDRRALAKIGERAMETFSEDKALALFRKSRTYGTWHTPTLTLRARMSLIGVKDLVSDPRLKYIPASVKSTWEDPTKALDKASSEQMEAYAKDFNWALRLTKLMRRAGLDLLAGTDTGDPYVLPGFALHDELSLLVLAGLTPLEAIQTATRNPALFFGIEKTHGTIEAGKVADLVLLEANPLSDIRNTRRIEAVVHGGRLYGRKELDAMLKPR